MRLDDLVDQVWERANQDHPISKADVGRVLLAHSSVVTEALQGGQEIPIRDVGRLTVRHKPARQGRHPRTGDPIQVPARCVAVFSATQVLKRRLNPVGN